MGELKLGSFDKIIASPVWKKKRYLSRLGISVLTAQLIMSESVEVDAGFTAS